MGETRFEEVEVAIDKPGMAGTGWQADEVRARLVVTPVEGGFKHELAVSGNVRFFSNDWRDRFVGYYNRDEPPILVLRIARADSDALVGYVRVAPGQKVGQLESGATRFSLKSASWSRELADSADELRLSLTAYDFTRGLDAKPKVPEDRGVAFPVELADETTRKALRVHETFIQARAIVGTQYCWIGIAAEGTFGPAGEKRSKRSWLGKKTALPHVEIEILDESGFILSRDVVKFDVSWRDRVLLPRGIRRAPREPRWAVQYGRDDTVPGTPSRAIVRFVDSSLS